jgi:hypothetical protein
MEEVAVAQLRLADGADIGQSGQQLPEGGVDLTTGQLRAETVVDAAAAERDEDDALSDDEEEELDEETKTEIKEIERIGKEIERVLLRIGTSQEPLADKDLLALKRLGVVDQGTMAATQGEAKRLATEATSAIKVRVAGLKGTPPKSGALSQKKKK